MLAATLVSAIFGLLAVRTSGVYFLLLTLALGMIIWGICLRWTQVTGGENGMRGDVRPAALLTNSAFYGPCSPAPRWWRSRCGGLCARRSG